jgi:multicomponent Na+:H+ antiporter subunit D
VNALLALPVVLPLLAAALSVIAFRHPVLQRGLSLLGVSSALGVAIALLVAVAHDGPQAVQAGGWPAPLGITLVADLFSGLMLTVGLVTVLAVLVFAIGQSGPEHEAAVFHPVYLVMTAGVALAFLTGDLFDLFVAFEITLSASYVLITLGGRRQQVRSAMTYVVINLLASVLFVTVIAFIYAATGTVNLAELSRRLVDVSPAVRDALALMLLVVFGIKAAIFPLFFWLPDAYPTARTPVTAVFAGLLTKVGIYSIVRAETLLFPIGHPSTLLLVIAGLTMIVGVLGAIAQDDMKRILSFHIVSQIGYMMLGVGLFTVSGLAATVFFILHQIPVKASLFLVGGLVEHDAGSTALSKVGGLVRRIPWAAVLFLVVALSLAGVPPLSGFVGKLGLVTAGLDAGQYAIVAVSLVVSVLTLFSMVKIWNGVFWGVPDEPTAVLVDGASVRTPLTMNLSATALVVFTIGIAVFAGPLYELCQRAAQQLIDPSAYVRAVLG